MLIIWPSFLGNTKYGVKNEQVEEGYEVMINKNLQVVDNKSQSIINTDREAIIALMNAAETKWGEI